MTKPIPDDLPQGPYEVFKCDDERWGWDVEDKDGQLIAQNCTEQFARAIAEIPEMRADNERLRAVQTTCDVFKEENRRLRAKRVELRAEIERWDETDPLVNKRLKEDLNEILTLRKEKAELIEMLATRTTHPEYVELLRRYKNETETP